MNVTLYRSYYNAGLSFFPLDVARRVPEGILFAVKYFSKIIHR